MSLEAPWYHRWFGEEYLQLYPHRSEAEAAATAVWLKQALNLQPPARILDLACGSGRHSRQFAELGFDLYSLDLSWVLLRSLTSLEPPPLVKLLRGDMRNLPFQSSVFDLALSLFTSFGYFEKEGEDLSVLQEAADTLKIGGRFVLDFLNADAVKGSLLPEEQVSLKDSQVLIQRCLNPARNRIEKHIRIFSTARGPREYLESVRLYTCADLRELLSQAGLNTDQIYGDYNGAPFTSSSPRLIIFSSKRG